MSEGSFSPEADLKIGPKEGIPPEIILRDVGDNGAVEVFDPDSVEIQPEEKKVNGEGIPSDKILYNVLEPEEEGDLIETPSITQGQNEQKAQTKSNKPRPKSKPRPKPKPTSLAGTSPEITTISDGSGLSSNDGSNTNQEQEKEDRNIYIDIISAQEAIDKKAHDQAIKDVTAQIKNNRWFEVWHWPRKIGLRLVEGGAINIQTDRLRQANLRNNTSFCGTNLAETAAKGVNERSQILERFKKDQTLSREDKIEATGALKQALVGEVLKGIVGDIQPDGTIANVTIQNADQLRTALTAFVHNHLNDPDPAVRADVERIFGARTSDFGNIAEYFASDMLEMGLRVQEGMRQHKESLEQIDQYIHINLGLAREAANTDTRSITDRAVAWARQRQNESLVRGARGLGFSGIILNPAVVGIGVALGAQGILRSAGWTARAAAVLPLLPEVSVELLLPEREDMLSWEGIDKLIWQKEPWENRAPKGNMLLAE